MKPPRGSGNSSLKWVPAWIMGYLKVERGGVPWSRAAKRYPNAHSVLYTPGQEPLWWTDMWWRGGKENQSGLCAGREMELETHGAVKNRTFMRSLSRHTDIWGGGKLIWTAFVAPIWGHDDVGAHVSTRSYVWVHGLTEAGVCVVV